MLEIVNVHAKRRPGISGIVASVILFAMLFTVGSSYFLFVNQNDLVYSQALSNRANAAVNRLSENLLLTATAASPGKDIMLKVSNVGGIASNITAVYVINASNNYILKFYKTGTSGITPGLPVAVNVGSLSSSINTGQVYASGWNYIIKAVTQRGGTFSTTFPPSSTSLAARALSSGAIGDLYLNFQSYEYYTLYTGGTCPTGGSYSGYCLNFINKAFAISVGTYGSANLAFSVSMTDLNNQTANIVLDPYTLLTQIIESGGGAVKYVFWYVVSNTSSGAILSTYTPIVLEYNKPTTVVFASSAAIIGSTVFNKNTLQSPGVSQPSTAPLFMVSHGCEGIGKTTCSNVAQANYGQNSPYVTTLYY